MSLGTKAATAIAAGIAATQADDADAGLYYQGFKGARDFARRVIGDWRAPNILPDALALNRYGKTEKQALRELEKYLEIVDDGNLEKWAKADMPPQRVWDRLSRKAQQNWSRLSPADRVSRINDTRETAIASHMHDYLQYNDFADEMLELEGGVNGPGYLTGLDVAYEEFLERLHPRFHDDLAGYTGRRLGAGAGFRGRPDMAKHGPDLRGEGLGDRAIYDDLVARREGAQQGQKSVDDIFAETTAEREAAEAAAETAVQKNDKFRNSLLGGAAGAGVINSDDSEAVNGGLMQPQVQASPTDIGLGPTAEEKLMMEYEGAHDNVRAQPQIMAPQSEALQQFTMGARDLERTLQNEPLLKPLSLLFPSAGIEYLETVNRPNEDPTWGTRLLGLLDFMP